MACGRFGFDEVGVVYRMTNDNGWLCAVFHDDTGC